MYFTILLVALYYCWLLRILRIFFLLQYLCVFNCNHLQPAHHWVLVYAPSRYEEQKCCALYQTLACYYRTSSFSCYVVLTEGVVLKCYCYAVLSDMPHLPSANNLNTVAVDGQQSVSPCIWPSVSRKRHRPPRTVWGHRCRVWDADVRVWWW